MKKINFKQCVQKARWLLTLGLLLTLGVGQMWAADFTPVRQEKQNMSAQQVNTMTTGAYTGTVYEPFSSATPSERAYSPAKAPGGPRRISQDGRNPGDATEATTESPIGEPWVMVLFALAFAGIIMIKKSKKSTDMKSSTKFIATLALFLTLGVGNAKARDYTAGEVLFVNNIQAGGLGSGVYWVTGTGIMWITLDDDATPITGSYISGTTYAFSIPAGSHSTVKLHRGQNTSTQWNETGNMSLPATGNYLSGGYSVNGTGAAWSNYGFPKGKVIYLNPKWGSGNWQSGSDHMIAYLYGGPNTAAFYDMTAVDNHDYYSITIPKDYTNVIFCRTGVAASSCTWENVYNKTYDLSANSNNLYSITAWHKDENNNNPSDGNWSSYIYYSYFRRTNDLTASGNWSNIYIYEWKNGGATSAGYIQLTEYNSGGTGKWYKALLHSTYDRFILADSSTPAGDANCGGHKTVDLTSSTSMENHGYQIHCKGSPTSKTDLDLVFDNVANLQAPTVELNYIEPSKTIMALTGHITNFGYDIQYVNNGYECGFTLIDSEDNETEYTACNYVDDQSGYFSKTITGLKEGETYRVKVWAKNGYAKGVSAGSGTERTMKSAGNARVWVYNEANDATVYLHAWYTNKCTGNVSEVTFPGYVMNHLEGTKWWWFDVPNDYPRFILSDGTNEHKTPEGQDKGTSDYAYFTNKNHLLAEYTGGHPSAYYIESKVGERKYYSNVVTNTTDTMSFYASSTGTIKLVKADGTKTGDLTSSLDFGGASGGVFTAKTNGSALVEPAAFEGTYHIHVNAETQNHLDPGGVPKDGDAIGDKFTEFHTSTVFGDIYNYYWVDWFPAGSSQSVIASVGNRFNDDLAGVLGADAYAPSGTTTTSGANVRYGYNPETNYFVRAMISGSGTDVKIKALADNTITVGGNDAYENAQSFSDAANWVYTVNATIKGQSHAAVVSSYNGYQQPLEEDQQLMGGNTDQNYTVMISYDFKTDRLIAAWAPDGSEIKPSFDLLSNIMIERIEDGNPAILNLADAVEIRKISQIYTVMTFNSSTWNASNRTISGGGYTDAYYWFSLPYDCYVSDIFGMSGYGDKWVVQTYCGDLRAKSAWWAEIDNWWYNLDQNDMMKAHEGYVLRMTNLYFGGASALRLYFPSAQSDITIGELGSSTTTTLDTLICHVWRKKEGVENQGEGNPIYDRRAIDSNWRVLGSPSFNSTNISGSPAFITTDPKDLTPEQYKDSCALRYLYTWEVSAGKPAYTITSTAGFTFPGTHAYLVQYAGTITWTPIASNPLVGVKAPARNQKISLDKDFRLVLKQDGEQEDVAYVSLLENGATEGYDMNLDLSKVMNSTRANLYTMAGYYQMAGNCLPISDNATIVPVGVQIVADGEYTFAMPEGTYGTGVILVDKVADTRTNLALTGYTITLTAGTYDERFELELSPIAQTPTSIEQTNVGVVDGVRKVMVDGVLYIVKDGKVFDARGNRVQ